MNEIVQVSLGGGCLRSGEVVVVIVGGGGGW